MNLQEKYKSLTVDRAKYERESGIQYKQLKLERRGYEVTPTEIQPTESSGYLVRPILDAIDKKARNTVAVNVGVGSGKSTVAYHLVHDYYKKGYKVIVASPFRSLVLKDTEYLREEIEHHSFHPVPSNELFTYTELEEISEGGDPSQDFWEEVSERSVHIMSIDCLLGSSGHELIPQTKIKTTYRLELIKRWKKANKKVVIFFDEIHESIHSFTPLNIGNLFLWKKIAFKVFVISATHTVSTETLLHYISYLTERKLHLIESPRTYNNDLISSDLELYFASGSYLKIGKNLADSSLGFVVNYLENSDYTSFFILSYSVRLAKEIHRYLKNEMDTEVQLSTGETDMPLVEGKSCVGTNFKTGVNISGENDLYIIILPSDPWIGRYNSATAGIFADGVPSIIQAVARMRRKGKILVVLPKMKGVLEGEYHYYLSDKLPDYIYRANLTQYRGPVDERPPLLQAFSDLWWGQKDAAKDYKEEQKSEVASLPKLLTPTADNFILSSGQKFLSESQPWHGKYVAPYMLWAAMNDQFQNCRLTKIWYDSVVELTWNLRPHNLYVSILSEIQEQSLSELTEGLQLNHYSCWRTLITLLSGGKISGVKYRSYIFVNDDRKDTWINTTKFRQNLFGDIYRNVTHDQERISLGRYMSYQMACAQKNEFNSNDILGAYYKKLIHALDRFIEWINSKFPEGWPTPNQLNTNFESEMASNLYTALKEVWDHDDFLAEAGIWSKPSAITSENPTSLYRFIRNELVSGKEKRIGERGNRSRVMVGVQPTYEQLLHDDRINFNPFVTK